MDYKDQLEHLNHPDRRMQPNEPNRLDLESAYRMHKPLLLRVAYRLLGTVQEAEDAVQDTFVALQSLHAAAIEYPKAYLVRAVTNHAINAAKSARRQRETYVGPWLPEPLLSDGSATAASGDPAENVLRQEQFGYAWMVMLEQLSPPERAAFVLRETLHYGYEELAGLLGRNEAACRKLYSRAKAKLAAFETAGKARNCETGADEGAAFVAAFMAASQHGNFEPLVRLLTDDAVLVSDGGGKVRAALRPIRGKARMLAFFRGIRAKGALQGELLPVSINGQPGLLLRQPDRPDIAICYRSAPGGKLDGVFMILNPDKLAHVRLFGA